MIEKEVVLKVSNLSKRIGKSSIIKDVSFELNKGEILGLLGPNGSGKTTILKMLVGLIKPTIGSIVIEKVNIRKDFERAITHVGAIIENPVMYDFLSGYDNLVHFFRMTNKFSNERIDEVIELLRMDDYIDDKVYTYSLGMRQRLGLAQAILHQPSILLLDEPTNGLDPEGIKSLRETLRKLANENGVSIIISSHILGEIELICDSVLVMDDGICIERGLLSELQNGTSMKHSYSFKVLNAENIEPILQTKYENDRIHYQTNGFSIELEVEEVAELNKLLVAAGINVIGIERIGSPLEELFLQKLRGEEI
ncbi:ABC transporter ATP-binding protein [Metabacillus bambusae]|uniref:ABC transporter ATP-binding protein n=1 Tax=Metabacillus bambusae TaxID=2795218 RepID=A0ABS3N4N4_9BACI|nr:ABC transporter ATP-binding protein [Metabacillus bambusae]MBO1513207.1 ABC transporter ATP-binding protein [Metabacillus bambusae]